MAACKTCSHPARAEIDRQIRAGVPVSTLTSWTRDHPPYVSRLALGRHRRHIGVGTAPGRKPPSTDFLTDVRDAVHADMAAGVLRPNMGDGIAAQKALDARTDRDMDREWQYRLVLALTGHAPVALPPLDPASAAIEAEYRPLLGSGEAD
jgi:hypothetical protein